MLGRTLELGSVAVGKNVEEAVGADVEVEEVGGGAGAGGREAEEEGASAGVGGFKDSQSPPQVCGGHRR